MSRLDSFIRRMTAQRDALNQIAPHVPPVGQVVELGYGSGRTYDHLVEQYGAARIIVFDDREWPKMPKSPAPSAYVLGDIKETAPAYAGLGAALVHADIGNGLEQVDAITLTWLPQVVNLLAASGGLILSGLPLERPEFEPLPLENVDPDRYHLYRKR